MKEKLTDELRELFRSGKQWLEYEKSYLQLTGAEKATILMTAITLGAVLLFLGMIVLLLLALSLEKLFEMMMCPALAYLSSAGVIILLLVLVFIFRRKLISDPIARFTSKLFISKD